MIETARGARAGVVAITFHDRGGGIAALSRLVVDALAGEGRAPRQLALASRPRRGSFATSTIERVAFAGRVGAVQACGRCDWLLFTHLGVASVQRAVPAWWRVPYAVYLHDVEAWTAQPPGRSRVLRDAFLRIANSEYTAARVAASNPDVGPIVACPLALGPEWERVASAPMAALDGPPTVAIVGRMVSTERYKGHDQILDVWPRVRAAVPSARLVCAGEGDDVARLRAKAATLGVADAVAFPGFVDDATRRALYQQASVFAMPSRREGFGLVYLEAMAFGVPCVGSIHDAASGVVVDGKTGVLVDQADADALAAALIGLLTDRARARALGEAGRDRFLAHYTLPAFRGRLRAAIDAAAASSMRAAVGTLRPTSR